MLSFLGDSPRLIEHILRVLHEKSRSERLFPKGISGSADTSAVLLLLGLHCDHSRPAPEPCLVFNKRSMRVKQPGDLCFPGGRIAPRSDFYLSKILSLPLFPLARWPYWRRWQKQRHLEAKRLALLLAASMREGLEEMRLNPLSVRFLGPLPRQGLQMFQRVIYPMVGWIPRQKRFFPNWEVEKIVHIPLQNLLNGDKYASYRLNMGADRDSRSNRITEDFPCFLHQDRDEREVLWGATYRITMVFLELVFGFRPPSPEALPVIYGSLDENYLTGSGRSSPGSR
ncbi:MAG: hypothetical protein V1751_01240 [Pseudomonadota bacterium]